MVVCQLAQLEHKNSVLESENQSLRGRLEGPRTTEKSVNVSLQVALCNVSRV